jgi:hypothetical protein
MIRRLIRRVCLWRAKRFDYEVELQAAAATLALMRGNREKFEEFTRYRKDSKAAAAWWRERADRYA